MDLELKDKVAIVTGASRGIGEAIARRLAQAGMRVTLAARSADLLQMLSLELGTNTLPIAIDLRQADAAERVVATTVAHFGSLDLLVNNAGATQRGDWMTLTDDAWQDGFSLKFFGAMRLSRASWPHLSSNHGGIINIAGIGGRTGSADFTIGGSVNAALMNLTKSLADRGNKEGVRVNVVNPGSIATERLQKRIQNYAQEHQIAPQQAASDMAASMQIPRFGTPQEVANMVAFLASPLAAYINGAVIDVDGGQTRTL